ncbi:MAG: YXWGXW repeat-containing protein [Candidatus Tectimicrobiota bacterium]
MQKKLVIGLMSASLIFPAGLALAQVNDLHAKSLQVAQSTTTQERIIIRESSPASEVIVRQPPPPPREEVRLPQPSPGHVWVPGYWTWGKDEWVWVQGRWSTPPERTAAWVPGQWVQRGTEWVWRTGHWE